MTRAVVEVAGWIVTRSPDTALCSGSGLDLSRYGSGVVDPTVTLARIPSRRGSLRTGESVFQSIRRVLRASADAPQTTVVSAASKRQRSLAINSE